MIDILVGFVLVAILILVLAFVFTPMGERRCPSCGGDFTTWTETRMTNGYSVDRTYKGCPKVRDMAPGSHYARLIKSRRWAKYDPWLR